MLRVFLVILAISFSANAEMKKVGSGELTWMFWTAYKAELFAPEGKFVREQPFELKLTYKMDFDGDDIADRSAEEMRKQKVADEMKLAKWHTQMKDIFPNVKEGDYITGAKTKDGSAQFLHNGKQIGVIKDNEFTKAFFDIWLSEKTSEPKLRSKLLAGK